MIQNLLRRLTAIAAGLVLAAGVVVLATSSSAMAAPVMLSSAAVEDSSVGITAGPFYLPYVGSNADIGTWVFGPTAICAFNEGSTRGHAHLQGSVGGSADLYPNPGQTACITDWWGWGTPVNVRNVATAPLVVWSY